MRYFLPLCSALLLVSCGPKDPASEDFNTSAITLPSGKELIVETVASAQDLLRGLQFRPSLAPDHGMLFIRRVPGYYSCWMYQTLMPLDMLWMSADHTIVEIVESAPPCKTVASQCAHYGGTQPANYILEIGGGMAKKYGLKLGDKIQW